MEAGDADAQLMLRYAQGDARAFDLLYANHRAGLWRFIRRTVGDDAATDDATHAAPAGQRTAQADLP